MNRHGVPSAFQPLTGDGDSIGFSLMDFSLDLVLNKGQDMYVFVLFKPRQISTKVRICMFLSFSSRQFSTKVLKARLCWKLRFPRPTLFLHGNNVAATCLWIWFKTGTTQHCEIMEQRAACASTILHCFWRMFLGKWQIWQSAWKVAHFISDLEIDTFDIRFLASAPTAPTVPRRCPENQDPVCRQHRSSTHVMNCVCSAVAIWYLNQFRRCQQVKSLLPWFLLPTWWKTTSNWIISHFSSFLLLSAHTYLLPHQTYEHQYPSLSLSTIAFPFFPSPPLQTVQCINFLATFTFPFYCFPLSLSFDFHFPFHLIPTFPFPCFQAPIALSPNCASISWQ